MKRRFALALLAFPVSHHAQQEFPATLAGHAWLPAQSVAALPADAPASFAVSGKFVGPEWRRTDAVGSIPGFVLNTRWRRMVLGICFSFQG